MKKVKLSVQEQINHIESKGITFNLISKDEAQNFLEEYNSYFRLKSYAKNFSKYNNSIKKGKYMVLFSAGNKKKLFSAKRKKIFFPIRNVFSR